MNYTMSRLKWTLVPLMLLATLRAYADPCQAVTEAAERAIQAQKAQIQVRDQEIGQARLLLESQTREISDLKESNSAWYNSKWLWLGIGAGVTALVITR